LKISRRKPSKVNFVRQAHNQVSGQDHAGAPVLRLLEMRLSVKSFHFADSELRQA